MVRRGGTDAAVALVLRQQRRRVAALRLAFEHAQEQGLQVRRCELRERVGQPWDAGFALDPLQVCVHGIIVAC